jgi:hypothetical protein
MSKKWGEVYKKVVAVNGKDVCAVYLIPRYKHNMPLIQWIRLKIIEWLITPFLMTKNEAGEQTILPPWERRLAAVANGIAYKGNAYTGKEDE